MKLQAMIERMIRISKQIMAPLLCILLCILILKQVSIYERITDIYDSFLPILMGGVLAFLFQPLIDYLAHKFPLRVSVMIVYVGLFFIGSLFVVLLVPVVYRQVLDFVNVIPAWIEKIEHFMQTYHITYNHLEELKETYFKEGYSIALDSIKSGMNWITKFGISYITAFFISVDLAFWKRTFKKLIPNYHQFSTFYYTMSNIIFQYLVGTFLDLFFISISVGTVLYLAHFPNAVLYAIILALLNLFPYVGATIGLVLIGVVGLLSYPTFPFVAFAIVWLLQQIESNVIQPLIFNRTMNVRPILTFVFIFISEAFFGVIGVILSPIFAAIAQIAFRSYLHSKTSDDVGDWDTIWQDFDEAMKDEDYAA
ncbi:MAG: AI-2E family transporter [Longicatena sp.]